MTGAPRNIVVLAVGRDPLLLEIRSRLLRRDGYTVVSELSIYDAIQQFVAIDFDLVILCHTIPAPDRQRLTNCVHNYSPDTPVVLVSATLGAKDKFADATVDNDPSQLLTELPKIISQQRGPIASRTREDLR